MDQLELVQRLKSIADEEYNLHAEFIKKYIYVLELASQEKMFVPRSSIVMTI